MRVLELFSGIGGMHYALRALLNSNKSDIKAEITAVENNQNANEVYSFNFGIEPICKNVESLPRSYFDASKFDLLLMSPPCQPFTRLGAGKSEGDMRCEAFLFIIECLELSENPINLILLENVQGFEKSTPRNALIELLLKKGFDLQEFILTPFQFGIPNSRPRYYLIAKMASELSRNGVIHQLQNGPIQEFGDTVKTSVYENEDESKLLHQWEEQYHQCHSACDYYHPKVKAIRNFLKVLPAESYEADICENVGEKSHPFPIDFENLENYKINNDDLISKFHICEIFSFESSCFTKGYPKCLGKSGSILRIKKSEENDDFMHRYFTEYEISSLLGFPIDFKFPDKINLKQRYAMLGNSLCVPVVTHLLDLLIDLNKFL
ncbi:tRNA (cytosine(38)-C(5))-methyltransferase-like [Symsagittifera roscoffensis]|uniref:tRNA (cytosine(38)-C(5))-methyltransferase-like n=1 Tax=Symsagittifera roscoffensis TaxID=84072 RepID=UPI00307B3DEB